MNKETIRKIESERIRKLPVYMFQEINARKMKLRHEGKDIIDLGMGNPDRPAPGPVVEKLAEVACDNKAHRYSASKASLTSAGRYACGTKNGLELFSTLRKKPWFA